MHLMGYPVLTLGISLCNPWGMNWNFLSQGHAEDVVLWHRYNYYVLGCGLISDGEYDRLEQLCRETWGEGCVCDLVGSSEGEDYPEWVREGRRPNEDERGLRDSRILERLLDSM